MKRLIAVLCVSVVILSLLLAACAKPAPTPAPAPAPAPAPIAPAIKLVAQSGYGDSHALTNSLKWWADELRKRTEGRVEVEVFSGTPLGKVVDHFEMMNAGTLDIGFFYWGYKVGVFPLNDAFSLPISVPPTIVERTNLYLKLLKNGWYDKEEANIKVIYRMTGPSHRFFTIKPVRKLEDIKGLLIGTAGIRAQVTSALGGSPVTLTAPETYIALEKGTIDGVNQHFGTMVDGKIYEVAKYATMVNFMNTSVCFLMSPSRFKGLPLNIQNIIDGLAKEASEKATWYYQDADEKAFQFIKDKTNLEIIELPPDETKRWKDKVTPMIETWAVEQEGKGVPARKYLEAIATLVK